MVPDGRVEMARRASQVPETLLLFRILLISSDSSPNDDCCHTKEFVNLKSARKFVKTAHWVLEKVLDVICCPGIWLKPFWLASTGAHLQSMDSLEIWTQTCCPKYEGRNLVLFPLCSSLCKPSCRLNLIRPQQVDIISEPALYPLTNGKKFNSVFYDGIFWNTFFKIRRFAVSHAFEPYKRMRPIYWQRNTAQKQGYKCTGTGLTSTINNPGRKDVELSIIISRSDSWTLEYIGSKTNVNAGLMGTLQVHKERGTEALIHPHALAALEVAFIFVQLLQHVYRYMKENSYEVANEAVVYSYSYTTNRLFQPAPKKTQSRSPKRMVEKLNCSHYLFGCLIFTIQLLYQSSSACTDIRGQLSAFNCLHYDPDSSTFSMTCSFAWTYNTTKCLVLQKNEKFEGNGHSINLNGVTNWEGLFRIATNENSRPSSLDDAPVIHDVHMIGGETSRQGGFIIQSDQKHFIVKHCSSSGVIQGPQCCLGGGGICGQQCSGDILITHSWSTGEIRGWGSGGIAGREIGVNGNTGNTVIISHCYSTGRIFGQASGGICGYRTGWRNKGILIIKQCYSLGEIRGSRSGGITGTEPAHTNGHVSITNCYSRGAITGSQYAGGICGFNAGWIGGTVILANVYASGKIDHEDAGGLIGRISDDAKQINITMSVYNGDTGHMVGGSNDAHYEEKISGDLEDITGTVYCYTGNDDNNQCWDSDTVWQAVEDDFPILQDTPIPLPSVTPTPTPSITPTPKETKTSTPSSTGSASNSRTITPSGTPSYTPTVTKTASQTRSVTPSLTSSETGTVTGSPSPTSSPSETKTTTPSATLSPTASISGTPTETQAPTSTVTPSKTKTPSDIRSSTPSGTSASTSTPTSSNTETMTPSHTHTPFLTGTVAKTKAVTCIPSQTESPTRTPSTTTTVSGTHLPSGAATGTVMVTTTITPSSSDSNPGPSTGIQSTRENPDILVSVALTGPLILIVMYIGYKRLQNKRRQKVAITGNLEDLYAMEFGMNYEPKDHIEKQYDIDEQGEGIHSAKAKAAILQNPLARVGNVQKGHEGTISQCEIHSVKSSTSSALPFLLVDMTSIKPSDTSKVKVVSSKRPDLRRIHGNTGSDSPKMQIARISQVDTSQMKMVDRTIIKLRVWKAKLLAEPAPVVEISVPEEMQKDIKKLDNNHNPFETSKRLVSQLEFAHRRENGRTAVSVEIAKYTQSRRQMPVRVRKKEFTAVLPNAH